MEEYVEKSPLYNTQEIRNEYSQDTSSLSSEEKSNIMEESFIDSSQNNATKFPIASVPSTIVEDRITCIQLTESDNCEKEPEKSEKGNNVETIKVLAGFMASDSNVCNAGEYEESKKNNTIYCCLNSDKSEQYQISLSKQISLIESKSLVMSSNNNQVNNEALAYLNNFTRMSCHTQNDIAWDSFKRNNSDVVSVNESDKNRIKCDYSDLCKMSLTKKDSYNETKSIKTLENKVLNVTQKCCIGETSSHIAKITVCAEIQTTYNSQLEQFQVRMNYERETSSVLRNYSGNLSDATRSNNEGISSIDQQVPCSELETTGKINYKDEQSYLDKHNKFVTDDLNLDPDMNNENKSLNKCVTNEPENYKEYDVCDIGSPISNIFDSNCSSPLNTSISEGINNAINVLDANIEKDEEKKGDTIDQERIWDGINKVVNISFEKYENFTADKDTLARPSTSEKMCQTDISSFGRKSVKRLLQFDDDESICTKKHKVSVSSDVQNERLQLNSNNDELFEADIMTPVDLESLNSEEFLIMNNKDICWSPVTSPQRRLTTIISTEQEREKTVEENDDSSLFDDEHDKLNWSSSTNDTVTIELDQLVPLPNEETESTGKKSFL